MDLFPSLSAPESVIELSSSSYPPPGVEAMVLGWVFPSLSRSDPPLTLHGMFLWWVCSWACHKVILLEEYMSYIFDGSVPESIPKSSSLKTIYMWCISDGAVPESILKWSSSKTICDVSLMGLFVELVTMCSPSKTTWLESLMDVLWNLSRSNGPLWVDGMYLWWMCFGGSDEVILLLHDLMRCISDATVNLYSIVSSVYGQRSSCWHLFLPHRQAGDESDNRSCSCPKITAD